MADLWNVAQYEKFKQERLKPGLDLIDLVDPRPGMRAVDLGCGTGELTSILHQRLPGANVVGIDRSAAMLEKAKEFESSGLRFQLGEIEAFDGDAEYDLIFSNAAFHWVADHDTLFARLKRALKPRGQFAVQVPANHDRPAFTIAYDITEREPYRGLAPKRGHIAVRPADDYVVLLDRLGFEEITVRMHVYLHKLESRESVFEWVRGTFLTDFENALGPELFARFTDEYRQALRDELEDLRPYPFTFKRILMHAVRPS